MMMETIFLMMVVMNAIINVKKNVNIVIMEYVTNVSKDFNKSVRNVNQFVAMALLLGLKYAMMQMIFHMMGALNANISVQRNA